MPDKVILEHKMSYLFYFENFHFLWFFHLWPIFAKNWKKWKFSKLTKYDFLWSKMTLSGIIYAKTSQNSEVRTAFWRTLIMMQYSNASYLTKRQTFSKPNHWETELSRHVLRLHLHAPYQSPLKKESMLKNTLESQFEL